MSQSFGKPRGVRPGGVRLRRNEPSDLAGLGSGNLRDGSTPTTVPTEVGDVGPRVLREPNGSSIR